MATRLGTPARIRVRAAAPVIVEKAGRHAGRLTGGAPRRALAADGDAVAVEDQRADAALVGGSSIAKRPFTSCVAPRSDRACLASGTSLGRSWQDRPAGVSTLRAAAAWADGARPLGLAARSGPTRVRVRPRRPAPSPRVPRSLASPSLWAWTRSAAHRRAVSGDRRLLRP